MPAWGRARIATLARARGVLLSAAVWLAPPAVLPVPSRSGAEGPPRAVGAEPRAGRPAPPTTPGLARAQDRALLEGPFPSGGLVRGVSEGTLTLSPQAGVRALTMSRIREAGAAVVRIPVDWRDLVDPDPGPGFDAADPASPSYDFAPLDAAVISAVSAGLTPLLVVSHAPAFAEASPRWPYAYPGSWDPDPAALEAFATALAARYDGSFPDLGAPGGVLPRVWLLQAWNEPNLSRYLAPQWVAENGHWRAFAPLMYRRLLNAFYAGVKAVAGGDTVVAAGVAPNGDAPGVGRMQPVRFLAELLCLPAGVATKSADCAEPPRFDVLAFHPLSVGDPDVPAASSADVAIADAAKVVRLLRRAERLRTALPLARKPVWATEINWESQPQAADGVPPAQQARWVSRALHRLWVAGVSLVAWQFLVDPYPNAVAETSTGGAEDYPRPAGLYSAGPGGAPALAQPKPFLTGFALPFDPLRVNARRVRVWALLARPHEAVTVQRRGAHGAWVTVARLRADGAAVLNAAIALRGAVTLRLLAGGVVSAAAPVPARRSFGPEGRSAAAQAG